MLLNRSSPPRPRVLEAVAGKVSFEHGSALDFGRPDRAAVVVHWAPRPQLSRSFVELVGQLSRHGYRTVVVSACPDTGVLQWGGRRPPDTVVLRKPNVGYDFGSWSVGLAELPAIASAERVILANDSMVGPFTDLMPTLEMFESARSDVWALTDTRQYFRHLQSYFLGFAGGVLDDAPLARFFANVRHERDKWDVIYRYELGLSRVLRREAYGISAGYRADDVVAPGENPVIRGWWRLLLRRFPFVKREIIRDPDVAPRGEWVPREVRAIFGERIEEWL